MVSLWLPLVAAAAAGAVQSGGLRLMTHVLPLQPRAGYEHALRTALQPHGEIVRWCAPRMPPERPAERRRAGRACAGTSAQWTKWSPPLRPKSSSCLSRAPPGAVRANLNRGAPSDIAAG